jgi:hypothetical protein
MTTTTTTAVEASGRARRRPREKKKYRSFVTPWPFNNHYEEVLEARYEKLASRAALEYGLPDNTGRRVRKRWQRRQEEGRSVEEGPISGDGRGKDG